MQNYNQQQQAVILKGIAQQILSMNVPTFEQANKLFKEFGIFLNQGFDIIELSSLLEVKGIIQKSGTWRSHNSKPLFRIDNGEEIKQKEDSQQYFTQLVFQYLSK